MRICFLVGSIGISGGTYVIIQHAHYLMAAGHDVVLAIQTPFGENDLEWHDLLPSLTCVAFCEAINSHYDLIIATWWRTALELHNFKSRRYSYFVQSIESRFYNDSDKTLKKLVDSTYDLPVFFITEATWIQTYLKQEHGKNAVLVKNGIRKDIFAPKGSVISPPPYDRVRVLVEGPFGVPFKNTALAVALVKKAGADEVWVLTSTPVSRLPGVNRVFSRLATDATAAVYRSCDVIVKLSTVEGMFGPPLEMFHCGGTAVVYAVTGHDEYIIDGVNSLVLYSSDAEESTKVLSRLFRDKNLLNKLKIGASVCAENWPDWSVSSAQFCLWAETLLENNAGTVDDIARMNKLALEIYHSSDSVLSSNTIFSNIKEIAKKLPSSLQFKIKAIQAWLEVLLTVRKV